MQKVELDTLDESIFSALRLDGRATAKSLGKKFGVAHTTIAARIQRMRDMGIMHVRAVTDASAYGYHELSIIGLKVKGASVSEVAQAIPKSSSVIVYAINGTVGRFDLMVTILAKSVSALQEYIDTELSKVRGISGSELWLATEVCKFSTELALFDQAGSALPPNASLEDERKIMELFYQDGRLSYIQASRMLKLSEAQIRNKVTKLVKAKLLHFSALKDPKAIGQQVLTLFLMSVDLKYGKQVAEKLAAIEEFVFVGRFVGRFEIICLATLPDISALFKLQNQQLEKIKGLIRAEPIQIVQNHHQEPRWVRII
jgi:DNA-binding Lrp family transcriptional regulator